MQGKDVKCEKNMKKPTHTHKIKCSSVTAALRLSREEKLKLFIKRDILSSLVSSCGKL